MPKNFDRFAKEEQKAKDNEALSGAVKSAIVEALRPDQVKSGRDDDDEEPVSQASGDEEQQQAVGDGEEKQTSESDGQDDEQGQAGESDEQSQDDARLGEEDFGDESIDQRRARRREERHERKRRAREERIADKALIESLSTQIQDMQSRLEQIGQTGASTTLAQIESKMEDIRTRYQQAESLMSKAIKEQKGEDFSKYLRARDELRDEWQRLGSTRQALLSGSRQQQQRPTFDPMIISRAQKFASENKWYDPAARDEDSKIMLMLDRALTSEGFDPKTDAYWRELKVRGARRLPHRFPKPAAKIKGKPLNMGGAVKQSGVQANQGATLSKQRRDALVAAGVEPGTPEWTRRVQAYKAWDKQNGGRAA